VVTQGYSRYHHKNVATIEECKAHCISNGQDIYALECPQSTVIECWCYGMDTWNGSGSFAGNQIPMSNCEGQSRENFIEKRLSEYRP